MNASSLVYPMFAMVLLTGTTLILLFRGRLRAVRERKVTPKYFQVYQGETEPEATAQTARHFVNLFEAPTLFYAACLAAMVTGQTGTTTVVLAWSYVAARLVHSYIHLGGNVLQARIGAYFTSWAVLIALWSWLVVGVASAH
jgi:hypothetical protein